MRQWVKFAVLLVVIITLMVATRLLLRPTLQQQQPVLSSAMQSDHFRYTEVQNGVPIYHLSGERMYNEVGKLGDMRVAVMRVVNINQLQLELLQAKVKGWVLTAEHGQLISGNRQLSLWGRVHGERKQGGTLRAGRLLVDPIKGSVKLRDGFVLDTDHRHERGIATALGR